MTSVDRTTPEPEPESFAEKVAAFNACPDALPPTHPEGPRRMEPVPEKRPYCGKWPFPSSDLDLVMPEDNAAYHRARGCCDG